MSRGAVFLDRDGTIIRDANYISKPEQVELLPGAALAIRRLNDAQVPVVVVTNQSGIARGMFAESDYQLVRDRVTLLLSREGARVDATYMCPHHPDFTGPCECRKPGSLLFRQAAEELDVHPPSSWFIGDRLRDVLPAQELGGRGALVPSRDTPPEEVARARAEHAVDASLDAAVSRVLESLE